jgi:hypothetical protein
MTNTFGARLKIESGLEEDRHAEVAMHIDRHWDALVDATKLPTGVEFEPREFCQSAVAFETLNTEGALARLRTLPPLLFGKQGDVGFVVSAWVGVGASAQDEARCRPADQSADRREEFAAIESVFHWTER